MISLFIIFTILSGFFFLYVLNNYILLLCKERKHSYLLLGSYGLILIYYVFFHTFSITSTPTFILFLLVILIITNIYNDFSLKAFLKSLLFPTLYFILNYFFIIISQKELLHFYNPPRFETITGMVLESLCLYIIYLIIIFFSHIIQREKIELTYWLSKTIPPASALFLLICSLFMKDNSSLQMLFLLTAFLLIINILSILSYERTSKLLKAQTEAEINAYKNKHYVSQLNIIEASNRSLRGLKHDMQNHLYSLRALISQGEYTKANEYLNTLTDEFMAKKIISDTGNIAIDSLLNFKLGSTCPDDVNITCKMLIPDNLPLPSYDLTVILGNLTDNALEAVSNLSNNKEILLICKYDKNRFLIKMSNTFDGEIFYDNGKIISKKKDKIYHGYGLDNIKKIVEKYSGTMDINYSNGWFTVVILLLMN